MNPLAAVDLNLLRPLQALLEERQVSRAAQRLGLTQSAMSRILLRLRNTLGDDLLIRTPDGYRLTPRAERIYQHLLIVLPQIDGVFSGSGFDPETETGTFRMSCTDYQMSVFGPALLKRFRAEAPGAVLHLETMSNRFGDELEFSHVDLAVAPFLGDATPEYIFFSLPVQPNLTWEKSYTDHNVCVMAAGHPLADNKELSLAEYLDCDHALTTTQYGIQASVDPGLMAIGLQRRAAVTMPCYEAAVSAVAGTRLVMTLPARLAAIHYDPVTTKVLAVPTEIRILRSYLMWHPRLNSEPRQQWFRQLVRRTLPRLEEPPLTAADVGSESRIRQEPWLEGQR